MNMFVGIILSIVSFLLWIAMNYYVFLRIWESLTISSKLKIPYIILAVLLTLSLPVVMRFRLNLSLFWSELLQNVGGLWLLILLYAAIACLLFDIVRAFHYFIPFFPEMVLQNYVVAKRTCFIIAAVLVIVILVFGNYAFKNPKIVRLELTTDKPIGEKGELKLLFFSDLHLGSMVSAKQLQKYVKMIEQEDIDILLIGGDFIDGDEEIWEKRGFASILGEIKPELGVFVALGNHEYYNGLEESIAYIKKMGFVPLIDSCIYPFSDETVAIVGRDDRTNTSRLSVEVLLKDLPAESYKIVINHQPTGLASAEKAGTDLLLSGHTHNGQIFPATLFINFIWELAYGYEKIGAMDTYVSSGLGLWGPRFRIGSQSEMVHITIKSKK